MSTPILTLAESQMKSVIEAMTVSGGYYYNWGTVNERDMAKCLFPCAIIKLEPDEENLDEPDGIWAQAYSNKVAFEIKCVGKLSMEDQNPYFKNNETLNKILDDLKKVFGTNYSLNGNVDKIMYRGSTRIENQNNDMFVPSILITRWEVFYTQGRTNPDVPDP